MCTADVPGTGTVACGRDWAIYAVDSLTPTQGVAALTKLTVPWFCSVRVFLEGLRERPNNCVVGHFSMGTQYNCSAYVPRVHEARRPKACSLAGLYEGCPQTIPAVPLVSLKKDGFEGANPKRSQSTSAARFRFFLRRNLEKWFFLLRSGMMSVVFPWDK